MDGDACCTKYNKHQVIFYSDQDTLSIDYNIGKIIFKTILFWDLLLIDSNLYRTVLIKEIIFSLIFIFVIWTQNFYSFNILLFVNSIARFIINAYPHFNPHLKEAI